MFMAMSPGAPPLALKEAAAPTPALAAALVSHAVGDARRQEVEHYIAQVYAQRYGALVHQFAPTLVSLQQDGEILAAAGYRHAACAPLFLERYLEAPIETLLHRHGHGGASRDGIVEVGHLASHRSGEGRRLIHLLAPHLARLGAKWIASTVTRELRHLFVRTGVRPLALGAADPAALGGEASHWGSYYLHEPQVMAGHLPQASRHLAHLRQPLGGVS